jgi:RimJ/RimL family protein N-acetyltransferase
MYEGALVRLREMRMEDARLYTKWLNTADMTERLLGGAMPLTIEQERAWIEANAGRQGDRCNFAVETLDGALIGSCGYSSLDLRNQRCMVGWFIGDAAMRGRGYGADMIETLLRVCFEVVGVRKVRLEVFEFNENAIRLYERLGFVLEGVFRKEMFCRGRFWDVRRYGLFRGEWERARGADQRSGTGDGDGLD